MSMYVKQRFSSQTVGESKTALERYFDEHGQGVSKINWMNLGVQTHVVEHVFAKIDCNNFEGLL